MLLKYVQTFPNISQLLFHYHCHHITIFFFMVIFFLWVTEIRENIYTIFDKPYWYSTEMAKWLLYGLISLISSSPLPAAECDFTTLNITTTKCFTTNI